MSRRKEILTAVGTLGCAAGIGFVMQSSDAAEKRYGSEMANKVPAEQVMPVEGVKSSGALLNVQEIKLTSGELESPVTVPQPEAEVITVAAPQSVLEQPSVPEAALTPACEISAQARPIAAAMVKLSLDAACLPNERVTVHHNGMIFTQTTSDSGTVELTVPALSEDAVFILAFSNGDGAVAQTRVEELAEYNRVVLQWKGDTGFQIHAREFGADYGEAGHIWSDAPGEMSNAVVGQGGFLTRHGDASVPEALMAEVYSFPASASVRGGDVALSVEAEVSAGNCGLEIEAQSLEIIAGGQIRTRNLTLAVPDCDSTGDFLVLNNLLEDLKVASN